MQLSILIHTIVDIPLYLYKTHCTHIPSVQRMIELNVGENAKCETCVASVLFTKRDNRALCIWINKSNASGIRMYIYVLLCAEVYYITK